MKIITIFRDMFDAFGELFNLRAAELRTGTSLIEAVNADAFATALNAITWDEEQREDVRHGALMMAQAGATAQNVERAIRDLALRRDTPE